MEKLLKGIGAVVLVALLVFFAACIGGTILWAIYEHIHVMFPTAVENGVLAEELPWWSAVCITWIFGILIKSGSSTSNSK